MARVQAQADRTSAVVNGVKCFTLDEANRSLVLVKRIVADIVIDYARLMEFHEAAEAAEACEAMDYLEKVRKDLSRTSQRLRTCLEELDDVGAVLNDWSIGAVTFPSIAGGREVELCWHYGQDMIAAWRDLGDPARGQEPIETLLAELGAYTRMTNDDPGAPGPNDE